MTDNIEHTLPAFVPDMALVTDIFYTTKSDNPGPAKQGPSGGDLQVLRVRFTDGVENYKHDITNPGWVHTNPALQVMAYLGVSPSTLEDAVGEMVPIVENDEGVWLGAEVTEVGVESLINSDWGPDDPVEGQEVEVEGEDDDEKN